MKAIIIPNPQKDVGFHLTEKIAQKLLTLGIIPLIDEKYSCNIVQCVEKYSSPPLDADLIIVVGGDGSVIDSSQLAIELDVPLLGVNLGRVGYLSSVEPNDLGILSMLKTGYNIEQKMLLVAERFGSDGGIISSSRLAVNDIVVSHGDYLGISDFRITDSHGEAVSYRADGAIISTPVGSTAYSLSAGGPVISHRLDSIAVTPVCPHSFFNRSIVYDPDEVITVINDTDSPLKISVDGRYFADLERGEHCRIRRSEKRLKVISFSDNNTFATLFSKIRLCN